jgi:YfiH family protein
VTSPNQVLRVRRSELLEAPVPASPVPRAELDEWRDRLGLVAGITERGADGFSLALRSPVESAAHTAQRFRAFRDAMRPGFHALQMAYQVHGTSVLRHEAVAPGWHVADDADGHVTDQEGLLLGVTVADCVPIYLAARGGATFALLHAGWRGIAAGILEAGIEALRQRAAVRAADVIAHFGVAICGDCYEVGPEVMLAVEGRTVRSPSRLDLRAVLVRRAEAAGLHEVSVSPLCTSCDADRFYSHRASGGGERQLAYLGRPVAVPESAPAVG